MSIDSLIVSIGIILLAARLGGWIFRHIGQPKVVGEMAVGIILGPSVFGHFFPSMFERIFSPSSFAMLGILSQVGMLLFMFLIGLEVDLHKIISHKRVVILTSNCSILVPLGLGIGLANALYREFSGAHVPFLLFAFFIGTAMSITAFPVLAGILKERRLLGTNLGAMAISCAAIDDASAWLLLAILTAIVHSAQNWTHLIVRLLCLPIFVVFMLSPIRRSLAFLQGFYPTRISATGMFSIHILLLLAASWITERLGIHALFGAFVAGLTVPRNHRIVNETVEKIESLTLVLLVPVFFALTGLRTRIDMLAGTGAWAYTAGIIAIATAGKLAGASLTSRATGLRWRDAVALGVLLNARGLVELVILNAGLDLGILSPRLFTMMVIMALVTTFMTTPVLALLQKSSFQEGAHGNRGGQHKNVLREQETGDGREKDRAR
jgi:Kef-type K+ transport system membrane component KefB